MAPTSSNPLNVLGVDVSHHNGKVDWGALAAAGVRFAFIKATQGLSYIDPNLTINVIGARRAGIRVGLYHFIDPKADGGEQAKHFLDVARTMSAVDLPLVLDVEDADGWNAIDQATRIAKIDHALQVLDAPGRRAMIYTSPGWWAGEFGNADFSGHPLWVAQYTSGSPTVPKPWKDWAIWQDSESATIAGATFDRDWMRPAFAQSLGIV